MENMSLETWARFTASILLAKCFLFGYVFHGRKRRNGGAIRVAEWRFPRF